MQKRVSTVIDKNLPRSAGIYYLKNITDGKTYIGQTQNIYRRVNYQHAKCMGDSIVLKNAIKKYGIQNFECGVLMICSVEELDGYEKKYISELNTIIPNGYNITEGGMVLRGDKNPFFGKHHTKEAKEANRIAHTGENNSLFGRKLSEEEKTKLVEAARIANIGRKHTNEHKKKVSDGNKGKFVSNETRKKMSKWQIGKKHAESTKKKISEAKMVPVLQFDLNGIYIQEFASARTASIATGVSASGISLCCSGKATKTKSGRTTVCKTAGGFKWAYKRKEIL